MSRRALARAALALSSAALTLALIEAGSSLALHYVRQQAEPPPELAGVVDVDAPTLKDPWLRYHIRPSVETEHLRTNEQGLRNGPIEPLPDGRTFRILLLGGSTAWGHNAATNEDTISAHMERWFAAHGGEHPLLADLRVEVLNGGVPGYVSWQSALAYAIDRRRLKPAVVVAIDGANDVHSAIRRRSAGGPLSSVRAERGAGVTESLLGAFGAWWEYRTGRMKCVRLVEALRPETLEERAPPPPEEVAAAYKRALELLADVARVDGALAVGVLQPMSIVAGTKPLTEFEQAVARMHDQRMPGRNAYYERCWAAFRGMFAELGAEREDLALVDAPPSSGGNRR